MKTDTSESNKAYYIRQLGLEKVLPEKIRPLIQLQVYHKGEYLCRAGEEVQFFHILVRGHCHVISSSDEGKEAQINELHAPSINGDIELFEGVAALNSVYAETEVTVIAISKTVFHNEMSQIPAFLLFLCRNLADKIYVSTQWHSSHMLYSAHERLSRYILLQMQKSGSKKIHVKGTEIAQVIGVSQRHLRRLLAEYEEEGIIERSNKTIHVIDRDRLLSYSKEE